VYGSWGSTGVVRGDDGAATNRYTNNRTGNTTRTVRSDEGNAVTRRGDQGFAAAGSGGNVYAGRDGNVYRKQDGTWQKYDNGGWNNTPNQPGDRPQPTGDRAGTRSGGAAATPSATPSSTPRSTTDQLNRDAAARSEGATRTKDYSNYKSGSSTTPRSTGSYRGSSGGARSGGARAGGGRRR
jgi:hypothetical protein